MHEKLAPFDLNSDREGDDVLLINVPATYKQGITPDDEEPPFGLLRVAVACERDGYTPRLLDAHNARLNPSDIDDILYGIKPRSVGINPTSVNVPQAQEIAELCASRGIPLILGGVHSTLNPFGLSRDFPNALVSVKGRGENAILHVLDDLRKGTQTDYPGVYYPDANQTRTDFAPTYPLDQLPLLDQSRWVINPINIKEIDAYGKRMRLPEISLYETAGCPYNCSFCASPSLVDRSNGSDPYQRPDMNRIILSARLAVDMGARALHFIDDMAFTKPSHFGDFAQGMESLKLPDQIYWRGMTRTTVINNCTDDDLAALSYSGCWRIAMGVESGDDNILRRINKGITTQQVRESVIKLRNAGIPQAKAFFIMGFPDETYEQMNATRKFIMELKGLGLTDISLFQFKPYPGTQEWQYLERTNPRALESLSYYRTQSSSESANATVREKIAEGVWLPDDLQIATVPSSVVRDLIIQTVRDFYE